MPRRRPADCCPPASRTAPLPAAERKRCVAVFRALGDPTRLEVFRAIAGHGEPICVCDLVARFDVSQPTISHHLKVLREAGLIVGERRGTWIYYSINRETVAALPEVLGKLAGERSELPPVRAAI